MAIIDTLCQSEFANRLSRDGSFTYEGAKLLFDYLEDPCSEEDIEFDLVAFRCDYHEMTLDEVLDQYDIEVDLDDLDEYCEDDQEEIEDRKFEAAKEYLEYHTSLVGYFDDGDDIRLVFAGNF